MAAAPGCGRLPEPVRAELGRRLRAARLQAGMTQLGTAIAAGVNPSHVCAVESGLKPPSLSVLFALCRAVGVDAAPVVAGLVDWGRS